MRNVWSACGWLARRYFDWPLATGLLYIVGPGLTCGGPWAAFSSGAVEAHPTLEYPKMKGDMTYIEAPEQLAQS